MSFDPIYTGWDVWGRISRALRGLIASDSLVSDMVAARSLATRVERKLAKLELDTVEGQDFFASSIAQQVFAELGVGLAEDEPLPLYRNLEEVVQAIVQAEDWFSLPVDLERHSRITRSELWEIEDHSRRTERIVDDIDGVGQTLAAYAYDLITPIIQQRPDVLVPEQIDPSDLQFPVAFLHAIDALPELVEHLLQASFMPEFDEHELMRYLQERLEHNLIVAAGGQARDVTALRYARLPTRLPPMPPEQLVSTFLSGTPLPTLFELQSSLAIPQKTRVEHQVIVAGSGHGKTQTLQHFILHDLEAVACGEASVVVIDSQSDLIENIAGLSIFAEGQPLADRLIVIDPTDIEYPVALNLFDAGQNRLDDYSPLEREKLTNSILELYDFVLGSLLDAGMTQKQNVIFRYITRLLLHIPNATIHTLRDLLQDTGYETYRPYMDKLEGTARAFFDNEFMSKEFNATKIQVLRRLYGILENQTFERMFSHPKSKLDLYSEMNAGKVILINTAKDLLKESGTQIFGRFFIAMIAQAAQERATLPQDERLFTSVYVDEAADYFDQNTALILSQARKYEIGLILASQYLGQMDSKLQEAVFANTSIKFAGGVSAKDARTLAAELRTGASFIESQPKLSFAAYVSGQTGQAVSLPIQAGQMEALPRMSDEQRDQQRDQMRERYAVHHSKIGEVEETEATTDAEATPEDDENRQNTDGADTDGGTAKPASGTEPEDQPDDGKPQRWE